MKGEESSWENGFVRYCRENIHCFGYPFHFG